MPARTAFFGYAGMINLSVYGLIPCSPGVWPKHH
jgi:hypothetical protein